MISSSNSKARREILRLENLVLKFRLERYRMTTLRDLFVSIMDPDSEPLVEDANPKEIYIAKGLDFSVKEGDRVGILGANGAGKTSLCKCIAGTYAPSSGKIHLDGLVRAIFSVGTGIQPDLTGRENAILLGAFMYPTDPNREKLIEDALQFSELGHFLDIPFRNYSSGMQARLCLSIASAQACDLLILDEVFEGADRFFKERIAKRFINIIEGSGACLFISHDAAQIQRVCNRAIVLEGGEIVVDGSVAEAIKYYSSSSGKAA